MTPRRSFVLNVGKFALATPPAVTLLLETSLNGHAIAKSNGEKPPRRLVRGNRETFTDRNHGSGLTPRDNRNGVR